MTVAAAVKRDLAELGDIEGREGLAQAALVLAKALDDGAGLSTAAVARELRATMAALRESTRDDDGADAVSDWIASLSAPVGDSPQS